MSRSPRSGGDGRVDPPAISRRRLLRHALVGGVGVALGAAIYDRAVPPAYAAMPHPEGTRLPSRSAAPRRDDPDPVSGGELLFGLRSEPDNLDPHVTPFAISHVVMMNCYDTLVWQDTADRQFKGGLADSWEVSSDGLQYTFRLKQNVTFHDGTPFNAEAVKFSFDRIADPDTKSGFAATLLGPYDHTDILDDYTAVVNFKSPYPPFMDSASQAFLAMVSPAAVRKYGADFGQNPVGTGAFVFKEWVPKDRIVMTRNPAYNWASPVFKHTGPAYLDGITFKIIPENASRITSLEAGDTNFVEYVPEQDFGRIRADSKYRVVIGDIPGIPQHIMFNTEREPSSDPQFRQALQHALDRDGIIKTAYFGVYEPVYSPLSPVTTCGVVDAYKDRYAYDPRKAADILEGAGWRLGSDGIREKDGKQLTLDFITSQPNLPLVQTIQGQLREVGIYVDPKIFVQATAVQACHRGEHNIGANGWISSDPGVMTNLFHSKNIGAWNWTRLKDSNLDQMLDDGLRAGGDPTRRCRIYEDAQKIVMDSAAFYPTYIARRLSAARSDVYGIRMDVRGGYPWLYDAFIKK